MGSAALLGGWLDDGAVVLRAAALAVGGGSLLLWLAARRLRGPAFGAANSVTLVRAALVVLLVALLGVAPAPALGWVLVGLGTAGVALDGVDGALARGRDEASEFGARFDMETDALLILVLAALVWQHGKAGVWILAAGLAALCVRRGELGFSMARRGTAAEPAPSSGLRRADRVAARRARRPSSCRRGARALALVGLAALVWSFGVDVRWLARRARS